MSSGRSTLHALEVLTQGPASARVALDVVEVLIPRISRSPTTPTGAGVTQDLVECLVDGSTTAHVTQDLVECLVLDLSTFGSSIVGPQTTHVSTFAV